MSEWSYLPESEEQRQKQNALCRIQMLLFIPAAYEALGAADLEAAYSTLMRALERRREESSADDIEEGE